MSLLFDYILLEESDGFFEEEFVDENDVFSIILIVLRLEGDLEVGVLDGSLALLAHEQEEIGEELQEEGEVGVLVLALVESIGEGCDEFVVLDEFSGFEGNRKTVVLLILVAIVHGLDERGDVRQSSRLVAELLEVSHGLRDRVLLAKFHLLVEVAPELFRADD